MNTARWVKARSACRFALAVIATIVGALAPWCMPATSHAAEWKPTEPIEMIIPTKAGSGVDNMARIVQGVLQGRKLVPTPIVPVNKPGANYGVAMAYLDRFSGDAHRIFIQTSTPVAAYVTGGLKLNYFDFTPLANLINEPVAFIVRPDSPITNMQDLMARLRKDPGSVSIGIAAARGNGFHITAALAAREAKVDINKLLIVVFSSSGDGIAQVMGGNIDMFLATPANFRSSLEAKKIRMIGMSSSKRLEGVLATVPTLKEQGLNVEFSIWRGVLGPKGLTPAQIRYWDGTFGRMAESEQWRQAVQKQGWVGDYRDSQHTREYIKSEYELLKGVLGELGMAKPE